MPARAIKKYLEENDVPYESLPHTRTYTAQETAERLHVHGWEVAKPVVLDADGELILAVLPAPAQLDIVKVKGATGASHVHVATESQFAEAFPDCDVGAMPPFGPLYHMKVWVDPRLAQQENIVFNAGTHDEAIRMRYKDFLHLVRPTIAELTEDEGPRLRA